MGAKAMGARVRRMEDPALLTGRAVFTDDIHLPAMLEAAFVRSAHAHARIRGVDASAAAVGLARDDERRERGSRPRLRFVQGAATALPLAPASAELVLAGHLVKHLDDGELVELLREIWRILVPGGLALLWEFAPTGDARLDRWNAWLLSRGVHGPRLRSTRSLLNAAGRAGFEFRADARLRPFLLPPIPRASILVGRPPESAEGAAPPPEPS